MVTVLLEGVVAATETGLANVVKFHASMERMKVATECASATSFVTTASAVTSSALATACAVRMGHADVTTMTVMAGNTAMSSHVPGWPTVCEGRGECLSTGVCSCRPGFRGNACQTPDCPGDPDCQGVQGATCSVIGDEDSPRCNCPSPYMGDGCEFK